MTRYIRQITITNILDMASNGSKDIHHYGTVVEPRRNKVKCNYCCKIVSSGFYRLKYHLGGVKGDVSSCPKVTADVKEAFRIQLEEKKSKKLVEMDSSKPVQLRPQLKRKSSTKSDSHGCGHDADAQSETLAVKFKNQMSSHEELIGSISEDTLNEMKKHIEEIKSSWQSTGCSILLDTWTDQQDRNLINVLVNCPKGTIYLKSCDISTLTAHLEEVIEGVGINNVVQIITNSTSDNMEDIGMQIMTKHEHIFWTISVSTCIELMLESIKEMCPAGEVLEKAENIAKFIEIHSAALKEFSDSDFNQNPINPSTSRSVVPYIILENTLSKKDILEKLFASSFWETSNLSTSLDGKRVFDTVKNSSFWNEAVWVMKGSSPILDELLFLTRNNEPQTGFIYERIDRLKETIRENLNNKKFQYPYPPFWELIDEIWNNLLHSHLHAGGYYFNPTFFYSKSFNCDPEVTAGLKACVKLMGGDCSVRNAIRLQVKKYVKPKRSSYKGAMNRPPKSSPVMWWSENERKYPDLSRMAIRILSQTCDGASKFNLNRSLAEMLMNEKRPIELQLLKERAYVQYNMRLMNFNSEITRDDIGPSNTSKYD